MGISSVPSREIEISEIQIKISFFANNEKMLRLSWKKYNRNERKLLAFSLYGQVADTHSRDLVARSPANKLRGVLFASSRNAQRQPEGCRGHEWRRKSRMRGEKEYIFCSQNARMDGFNSFHCRLHGSHTSCIPIQTRSRRKTIYVSRCSYAEDVLQDQKYFNVSKRQKS